MARKFRIPGVSYSWKRAVGITRAKQKLARATGIPTTKQGRQRKFGRLTSGGCCLLPAFGIVGFFVLILALVI